MKNIKKYLFTLLISITAFLFGINYVNAQGDPGEILISKTAVKNDVTYGRSANVTLTVNANAFTTIDKTDVVLVLDRSSSMNGDSMKNTKKAAEDLIDMLLTEKTKSKVRVGIVTYGTDVLLNYTSSALTNESDKLNSVINSIPESIQNQGTNIQAGLAKANSLLANSEVGTQKIVILLSDGEPTYYNANGKTHGMGNSDNYENDYCLDNGKCYEDDNYNTVVMEYEKKWFNTVYTTYEAYKPSTHAKNEATTIKSSGAKIYTIGFNMQTTDSAYEFLGNVASSQSDRYLASDYAGLKEVFKKIVNDFSIVATNAIVTDIVPVGFQIKEGTLPVGATAVENSDGITTITWNIGDVKSTDTNSLTYTVEAKDGYYGSMYTNVSAKIEATSADGNPKYGSSQPVSIYFEKPVVPIPGVTLDDDYTKSDTYNIKQGQTLTINATNGVLANDKLTHKNLDASAKVTDKIVLLEDTSSTAGKLSDITMDETTGAFTYKSSKNTLGIITYKYYVETTVTIDGETTVVKSNTSTITLKVIENLTRYTVNYLEKDTNEVLADAKVVNGKVFDKVEENAIDIYGYDKVNPTSVTIELKETGNEITFYYTKKATRYTVNYLEKDTNAVLADAKVVNGKVFDKVEESAIDIYGYDKVDPTSVTIELKETQNEITFYYTKRTDLSYTVNYLEKDTNKTLHESKEVGNITYNSVIKSNDEVIEIYGYEFDSVDKEELVIDVEDNEINVYYNVLYGTVKTIYVDLDNKVISDSIISTGKVEEKYSTTAREIAKYRLVKVEGEENGKYIDGEIIVTYIYEAIPDTGVYTNANSSIVLTISMIVFAILVFIKKKIFN